MRIGIDAGHGLDGDPGAVGPNGLREADVTQRLAGFLATALENTGRTIFLVSRDMVSSSRAQAALKAGCDAYISLHDNAAGAAEAHGIETWYAYGNDKGEALARSIQAELVKATDASDRGAKNDRTWAPSFDPTWTGGMGALRGFGNGPSCLVELLFVSNPAEELLLSDPAYLVRAAQAIASGVCLALPNGTPPAPPAPPAPPPEPTLPPLYPFPDVPISLWNGSARGMLLALYKLGAISGYEDGSFKPLQPMTRIEAIALAYKVLHAFGKV